MVTRLVLGYRRRLVRRCAAIAPVVVCARHRFIPHTSYPSRRPDARCRGAPRRQEALLARTPALASAGLYAPEFEHDACGVAMVADLTGRRDHGIVRKALTALLRLEHRGARGAEANTGDGAGILIQVPDEFYRAVVDFELPAGGAYAVGIAFLPSRSGRGRRRRRRDRPAGRRGGPARARLARAARRPDEGRPRPDRARGDAGFRQLFVAPATSPARRTGLDLERRAFCLRKRAEHATGVYFPSLSPRTIVYKGMLAEPQVEAFYPDLADERVTSALAWCTPGSPPTRSRRGRWRTRTATSRTTARSTRCAATATGWPPARRCCESDADPGRPRRGSPRSSPRTPATRRRSTRCSSCCTWAGAACRTRC